jgi:hypothetical protein
MKRLSNHEAREAIRATRAFVTHNQTVTGRHNLAGTGIMRNPAEIRELTEASVVYSYSTPIAWVIDGTWRRTEERYSVTTSKHTGLCPTTEVQ